MASLVSFLFIQSLLFLSFKYSKAQMVPAVFVFGDSLVDVGNNNDLPFSLAKANFPHNGIDFPTKKPTGRFCNGKTPADFLAEKLSLPFSPPYLSLVSNKSNDVSFLKGVNFASAGGGIFNATGQLFGMIISMTVQVDYYAKVYEDLVQKLGSNDAAQKHLSKSFFFIVTGSNDLQFFSLSSDQRKKNTPQQKVDSLILTLKEQLKRLHAYGARKFVVSGIAPIGCTPFQRMKTKGEECNEELNSWSVNYNEGLKSMLQQLKSELKDINYSYFEAHGLFQNIIQNSAAYGFTEDKTACCGFGKLNAFTPCTPISSLCSNRTNHVFWDFFHPTEATYRILVDTIFDGPTQYAFPMNARQLVEV